MFRFYKNISLKLFLISFVSLVSIVSLVSTTSHSYADSKPEDGSALSQKNDTSLTIRNSEIPKKFAGIRIKYVQGDVTSWSSLFPSWEPVKKGMVFRSNPLLKVGKLSRVAFEYFSKGEFVSAEVKTPMTIRLSKSALREVRQQEVYLQKIPFKIKSEEESTLTLTMSEAFARAKFLLKDFVDLTTQLTDKVKNFGFVQVKRHPENFLKIISPLKNAVIHPLVLPNQIKIEWEHDPVKDAKTTYEVFIWRTAKRPEEPIATVKGNHYFATLSGWEGYFLEVVASTGLKSGTRTFFFKRKTLGTKYKFEEKTIYDFVSIDSPTSVQLFLDKGRTKNYPFKFAWKYERKIPERHYFKVNIEKKSSSKILPGGTKYSLLNSKRVRNTNYVAGFDQGAYEWWLELVIMQKNGEKKSYNSNRHFISLDPPNKTKFGSIFSDAIDGLKYQTETHSTIYYE